MVGGWCGVRSGLVARLQLHETVLHMARATCVTVAAELDGELLLTDQCIHFVPDDAPPALPKRKDRLYIPEVQAAPQAQSWALEDVLQVRIEIFQTKIPGYQPDSHATRCLSLNYLV